jgi:hypothetical protein
MRTVERLISVACLGFLGACATTNLTAYTDPEFAGKTYGTVVVAALEMGLPETAAIESAVCKKVSAFARCLQMKQLAPPTRTYTDEELDERIKNAGADGVIAVGKLEDEASEVLTGYSTTAQTEAAATANSSTTGLLSGPFYSEQTRTNVEGSSTTTVTSTPEYLSTRSAAGRVLLQDVATEKTVWTGEYETTGEGLASVTDEAFASALADRIVRQLTAAGHLRAREK